MPRYRRKNAVKILFTVYRQNLTVMLRYRRKNTVKIWFTVYRQNLTVKKRKTVYRQKLTVMLRYRRKNTVKILFTVYRQKRYRQKRENRLPPKSHRHVGLPSRPSPSKTSSPNTSLKICREVFGNDIFDGLGRDGKAT